MAEKRLFHATIQNPQSNETDYEAFYEAHTVNSVRGDAGRQFMASGKYKGQAFTVKHENLTKKPTEFYDRLKSAESTKKVVPARVKGLGQRWEVQENEIPFVTAAVEGGYQDDFPADKYGWSAEDESKFRRLNLNSAQDDDDRVGLPDDEDDYNEDYHQSPRQYDASKINDDKLADEPLGWDLNIRAKPEFYDVGAIANAEDSLDEMARQDHMYALGGFGIPNEEKKEDTGELPKIEDLDATLEKLRRDPASYAEYDTEEIPVIVEEKRSSGNNSNSSPAACLFL